MRKNIISMRVFFLLALPVYFGVVLAKPALAELSPDIDITTEALPPLLKSHDRELYRQIFSLQEKGKWTQADRLIRQLNNKILMGHVLYQRYMHPTKYSSRFEELADWMLNYADHPGAERIYDLAKKKNPAAARTLHKPLSRNSLNFPADKPPVPVIALAEEEPEEPVAEIIEETPQQDNEGSAEDVAETEADSDTGETADSKADTIEGDEDSSTVSAANHIGDFDPDADLPSYTPRRNREDLKTIASLNQRIKRYLRRGNPEEAEKRLWAVESQQLLTPLEFDSHLTKIAHIYFLRGEDEKALALAALGANRSGDSITESHWVSGLAAWRLNDCQTAAQHFTKVAYSPITGNWTASAGAFWAARAHLVCGNPAEVTSLLEIAARYPRTFYGQIANRQLAQSPSMNWEKPAFTTYHFDKIHNIPSIQRVQALHEVNRISDADRELKMTWTRTSGDKHDALLGLAARLDLPNTQVIIGKIEEQKRLLPMDSVLYPVPNLIPRGGFTLDRAMILAFMRQESQFDSRARSYVGASGLMQLMPRTASDVSRDRSLRYGNRLKLEEPDYNMALGQRYLVEMMGNNYANGNLFLTAIAYNAGPGNMQRWLKRVNFDNDPLLFIESIPARETRNYIEQVLSNLWIYRKRLGQPTPSLDQVAAGHWPKYQHLDGRNDRAQTDQFQLTSE